MPARGRAIVAPLTATITNCIVANTTYGATAVADVHAGTYATITLTGANIISASTYTPGLSAGNFTGTGTIIIDPPNLAALASNGGPTQTMLPLTGSPAIDAASGSTATTDQRGFLRPADGDGNAAHLPTSARWSLAA